MKALIITADQQTNNLFAGFLKQATFKETSMAASGVEGFETLTQNSYDLVVIDWHLEDVTGPALLNRLRQKDEWQLLPVMVITSGLEADDNQLVDEFKLTAVVEKSQKVIIIAKAQNLVKESQWYRNQKEKLKVLVEKITPDTKDIGPKLLGFINQQRNPTATGLLLAQQLVEGERWEEAELIYQALLKKNPNSSTVAGEYAAMMHATHQHQQALPMLRSAHAMSPKNTARLCAIGDILLQKLEVKEAEQAFDKALAIDQQEPKANNGKILAKNIATYLGPDPKPEGSFANTLNRIGIEMIRNKQMAEGIKQYEAALGYVSDARSKTALAYNLALAYMKWEKINSALHWFQKAYRYSDGTHLKSRQYMIKLGKDPSKIYPEEDPDETPPPRAQMH